MESLTMPTEVRQAIDSQARVLKVLGGAGTGKSLVIEQRVLRLLRAGSSPRDIRVVAMNRMAARSLEARLASSGVNYAADVSVSTIRDICRSLLDTPEAFEATGRCPRLINGVEQIFLLEDIRVQAPNIKPVDLRKMLESLYRNWANLDVDGAKTPTDKSLRNLLESQLIARQAMLVAELPAVAWRYLSGDKGERDGLRIPHLLADDFQNLSRASQAVVGLLFSETLTVAGNPCQAQPLNDSWPYPQGLRDFEIASLPDRETTISDTETVILKKSLRCSQRVTAVGNALVLSMLEQEDAGTFWNEPAKESSASPPSPPATSPNPPATIDDAAGTARATLELLAAFDESVPLGRVTAVKWTDPVQECEETTSWLKRRSNSEKDPLELGNVLIVVPNRVWGRQFSKRLDALKVPHEDWYMPNSLRGNPLRLDASAGMRSFTLLTLAACPDDAVAWRSWCGFGQRQANGVVWNRLMDWTREQKVSVSEALRHVAQGENSPFEGSDLLAEAWRRATAILKRCEEKRGERLLSLLCEGEDPSLDDFEALVRPLDGTESALDLYERARDQLLDPVFTYERRLRVATFATAAALEAKLVILVGMVEGLIPAVSSHDSDNSGSASEEAAADAWIRRQERCALYDTLSRATSELVFSYFQKADARVAEKLGMIVRRLRPERGGDRALLAPSGFFDEMGHTVPGVVARLP
jgi:superfamily I DNA/RNA helicase